ncbi:MAG: glycosyltransferase family 4 protein [Flavobacteriales bacterium]|jgi:glycosyltransferase involved in cell wall biosynthesis|tara:strand:- start:121 stop:1149 length:1029 start_codon:yes stop_codon:yes gene_type:complete
MSKHLVLLTPGFPENENDSSIIPALQIFVKRLIDTQPDLKIKIVAFQYPFSENQYQWNGVDVIALNGQNKRANKLLVWFKAFKTLRRINKQNKIDIIHSFWLRECSFVGRVYIQKNKIKHLITAMGQDVLKYNKYAKFCSQKATIITLSQFQSKIFYQNYGIKSLIIPWGIDRSEFPKLKNKTIDILGVGSLNEVKNYPLFIRVIERLHKSGLIIKVEILGGGTLEEQVINNIKSSGLQEVIKLSGEIKREEVLNKMAKAKILLHTSTFESFGMVFIEALYSGMKIVSNEVGIAKKSSSWYVCNGESEMEIAIIRALKEKIDRELIFNVNETVNSYLNVYLD